MNPRLLWLLVALLAPAIPLGAQALSPVRVDALTTEHFVNPVGLGDAVPRLSWKLRSDRPGEVQTAYEIHASSAPFTPAMTGDLWESGKVASDQSILVPWGGKELGSRAQVCWAVRVWDRDGVASAWSEPASFELGLLHPAVDWKGRWITADLPRPDLEQDALAHANWIGAGATASQAAAARLVLDLPAGAKIAGATIDAIADGVVSLYTNGHASLQGSSSHAAPFHANFGPYLKPGRNVIALGAAPVYRAREGGRNALAAHGVVELEGGARIEFNTDAAWKAAVVPGPGRAGGPAPAAPGWSDPTFDDTVWAHATVLGPYPAQPLTGDNGSTLGPGRYLRKTFTVRGPVAKARLYSTALGTYEASFNGRPVNDHQLDPGFTDYTKRVMVQVTDVTGLLAPGRNTLGALLNDGWFAGRLGWMGLAQFKQVADHPLFNAQLELTYADGTTEVIATDATWKGGPGEIVGSDEQLGEVIDARRAAAWDQPAFDDTAWTNAAAEDHPEVALDPQRGPPVRRLAELAPAKITRQGNLWLVDFGQNMVGHVRLTAHGPAGTTITVTHGEMLNPDGTLFTENLRPALALDRFVLQGDGDETFEPRFTFHGFRYAAIAGYPGELTAASLRGVVVGSDLPATGAWESSNADLNQLYSNIVWSQRGNFLSIPTDCPQRDERLGWMGDAQVFAPTAALNSDATGFFTKWLVDVRDSQNPAGAYSTVAPRANQANAYPVWGDAGVIVPWVMYTSYGDRRFLEDSYDSMDHWMIYSASGGTLILSGGVADHLAPVPTSAPLVDTAYFANSAAILAKAAAVLGKTDDAAKYEEMRGLILGAFRSSFVKPDGSIIPAAGPGETLHGTQTALLLALKFDLVPASLRPKVADNLGAEVERTGHLTTGFPGTGLLNPTLTSIGRSDLAWRLMLTDTYPSWLFPVKNGATTMWERWDAWTPERGFQASSMNSFNHYSFGAVGQWMFSGAAGIGLDEDHPGYKHFFLAPQFTDKVTYVKASLDSPYGLIVSHWHTDSDQMRYDVTVPPNTTADLVLPVPPSKVSLDGKPLATREDDKATRLPLAAGSYHFAFARALLGGKP
jgi:alpha-L-rhamnosidase